MARLNAVPLPIETDSEMIAVVQELSRVACKQRSFVEVAQGEIVVHFEAMDDAVFFMDNLAFLLNSINQDLERAVDGPPIASGVKD